jgi:hypothetical protein
LTVASWRTGDSGTQRHAVIVATVVTASGIQNSQW